MATESLSQQTGAAGPPAAGNVYVGPRPFRTGEALYCRDRETDELAGLLLSQRLVLLHSPSGAGKTSLINAKLVPAMQDEFLVPMCPAPDGATSQPVVIRLNRSPEAADPPGSNRYLLSTLSSLEQYRPDAQRRPIASLADMKLDDYLAELHAAVTREPAPALQPTREEQSVPAFRPLVLVFDQFEELLTLDPTDEKAKWGFLRQLGHALGDEERWALFAIRQDFLGALEPYLSVFPTRLAATYYLDLLRAEVAAAAIEQPARAAGVEYEEGLIDRLITDLRQVNVQQTDGSFVPKAGPYVEPVQLQVVCQSLWQVRHDPHTIRHADLETLGHGRGVGVDQVLAAYYRDMVTQAARAGNIEERQVRNWFDKQLITVQGVRRPVLENEALTFGLNESALRSLDRSFLIRRESRSGAQWYELSHDRLVTPVINDNKEWCEEHLNAFQRQGELWEESGRPPDLLALGEVLREGRRWAKEHPGELTATEWAFLEACQSAQIRRNIIRGAVIGSCVSSLLMVILLAIAIWQYLSANKAKMETQQMWARGLFRPFGRQPGELSSTEVSALKELASLDKEWESVRLRFLEWAFADPLHAPRFAVRCPVAVQATVGLNRPLAGQTAEYLRKKLQGPAESRSTQTAAALAIAELDLADGELSRQVAKVLDGAMQGSETIVPAEALAWNLVQVTRQIPPEEAATFLVPAAKVLAEALAKKSNSSARAALGVCPRNRILLYLDHIG
jgi:hypothetical protein